MYLLSLRGFHLCFNSNITTVIINKINTRLSSVLKNTIRHGHIKFILKNAVKKYLHNQKISIHYYMYLMKTAK